MRSPVKSFLWLIPFLCFGSGYFAARAFLHQKLVTVPSLIGKPADTALILLSEKNLNPRIIGLINEPDLAPGTVLNQIPRAETSARPHQTIFLVLCARPIQDVAKQWVGMTQKNIDLSCASSSIQPQYVSLPHGALVGQCFAQFPSPEHPLTEQPTLYVAAGTAEKYIWPSLLGAPAYDAFEALKKQGISITIIGDHSNVSYSELKKLRIIDQRPLPGSFVVCDSIHKPAIHVRLGR